MKNKLISVFAVALFSNVSIASTVTLRNGAAADKQRVEEVYRAISEFDQSNKNFQSWILFRTCQEFETEKGHELKLADNNLFKLLLALYKEGKLEPEVQSAIIEAERKSHPYFIGKDEQSIIKEALDINDSQCYNRGIYGILRLCKESEGTGKTLLLEDNPTFKLLRIIYKNGVIDKETKDIIVSAYCGTWQPKIVNWRHPVASLSEKIFSKIPGYHLVNFLYFGRFTQKFDR